MICHGNSVELCSRTSQVSISRQGNPWLRPSCPGWCEGEPHDWKSSECWKLLGRCEMTRWSSTRNPDSIGIWVDYSRNIMGISWNISESFPSDSQLRSHQLQAVYGLWSFQNSHMGKRLMRRWEQIISRSNNENWSLAAAPCALVMLVSFPPFKMLKPFAIRYFSRTNCTRNDFIFSDMTINNNHWFRYVASFPLWQVDINDIGIPRPVAVDLEDFCAWRVHRVLNLRHSVCRSCPFPTAVVCIFDDGPTIAKYCTVFTIHFSFLHI